MRKIALVLTLTSSLLASSLIGLDAEAQEGEIRRDPEGITGISPYMEAVAKGRDAFTKGDHAAAIAAFDDAVAKDGDRVLAHLLKAQTQLDEGDVEAAAKTAAAADGKKGSETEQSKLLFLQAELKERQAEPSEGDAPLPDEGTKLDEALRAIWDEVKAGWSAYSAFVSEHSGAPNYSATATDRKQKVDDRVKREKDYAEVRARAENK